MQLLLAKLLMTKGGRTLLSIVVVVVMLFFLMIASLLLTEQKSPSFMPGSNVSAAVLRYQAQIQHELEKYQLGEHLALVLAITMQESGGNTSLDVMQSSESIGLPPNTITDPIRSIEIGVKHFHNVITLAEQKNVDINAAVQSYNYGTGYLDFVAANGGKHSEALAKQFSLMEASKLGWASYGDPLYVAHVMRYVGAENGAVATMNGSYKVIYDEMMKYQGYPYVFGGAHPQTSFDCSGLMQWAYAKAGIQLPRTAQQQYNVSQKIGLDQLQPGDFVFFTGTYDAGEPVSHIGMYVGQGKMYNANGQGVVFTDLADSYWQAHLYGYGRVANFSAGGEAK